MENFFLGLVCAVAIITIFEFGFLCSEREHKNKIVKSQVIYIEDQGYKCEKVK